MPKSKRDKKVSLTQTRKEGLELKQKLIEKIRETADQYASIFTFCLQHERCSVEGVESQQVALGRTEDECRENLSKLTQQLQGQTGFLFTNKVLKYFDELYMPDYARSGTVAAQTVELKEGPLPEFSHLLEPPLRQLGLPTQLKRGVVQLQRSQSVKRDKCRILKLFVAIRCPTSTPPFKVCGQILVNGRPSLTDQNLLSQIESKLNTGKKSKIKMMMILPRWMTVKIKLTKRKKYLDFNH